MENKSETVEIVEKNSEKGATMVEYALIAALIAIVCIAAVGFLGQEVSETLSAIGSNLATVNN